MNFPSTKIAAQWSLLCSMAFFAVGCERSSPEASWWEKENERIALEHELELKTFRFNQVKGGDMEELRALGIQNREAAVDLTEMTASKSRLQAEIQNLESEQAHYRLDLLAERRRMMTGKTFEKLSVASGKEFQNAKVAAITDAGITIRHVDGSATLRFNDLTAGQREEFGLDPELALVAENKEREQAVAYERWLDRELAASQAAKTEELRIAANDRRNDERRSASARQAAAASLLVASNSQALAQSASSVGSGYYGRTRYRTSYYNVYRPYYCRTYVSSYRGVTRRIGNVGYVPKCYTPRRVTSSFTANRRSTTFAEKRAKNIP